MRKCLQSERWNTVFLKCHMQNLSFLKNVLLFINVQFSSVQSSHSVVSDSLQPHESQYARSPYPSPSPGVHPNSCASSRWCHPAISSSVVPFSSCPQSLPASILFLSGATLGITDKMEAQPQAPSHFAGTGLEWRS